MGKAGGGKKPKETDSDSFVTETSKTITKYWCDKCNTLRGKEMMKKGRVVCYECGALLQEVKIKQNEKEM